MTTEEKKIISIIKTVSKSVVSVNIFKFNKFIDGGSGFIVNKNGIIVTSTHVIHRKNLRYEITTSDNKKNKATLIGIDRLSDVAFLKIPLKNKYQPVKFGNSSKIEVGQTAIAIGNPLGLFPYTATRGIISGLFRTIEASGEKIEESLSDLIQTDVAINPGESGGPLINTSGEVIGMNVAIASKSENISFATPVNIIKKDLEEILRHGRLVRPFLGIRYITLNDSTAKKYGLKQTSGVLVISPANGKCPVFKGSPAYYAGIKNGDIITHVEEDEINNKNSLHQLLKRHSEYKNEVSIKIIRKEKLVVKKVKLD